MLRKYFRLNRVLLLITLASIVAVPVYADSIQPGSADDPIVTKSYVDQTVAQKVKDEMDKASKPTPPADASVSAQSLEVVTLQPGQTLMAGAGTEFILRTGKAAAVSNDADGIPDVTVGKDVAAGTVIELNHLLIFPREGRGIKADPKGKDDIFVMVRGKYLLVKQ